MSHNQRANSGNNPDLATSTDNVAHQAQEHHTVEE